MSFKWLALILAAATSVPAQLAAERGKYVRRQAARGELTDTSAKLSSFAFIDDREQLPHRLVTFVDVGGARDPVDPRIVPVWTGIAHRGKKGRLPLRTDRFRLSWEGGETPLRPLTNDELGALPSGRASLRSYSNRMRTRVVAQPFGPTDGLRVPARFYADPATSTFLNDDAELTPGSWFADVLFFHLPDGLDRWSTLFELSFLTDDAEAASVTFRIERDPSRHRDAFRRARKARKVENRRERKARRRAERAADGARDAP